MGEGRGGGEGREVVGGVGSWGPVGRGAAEGMADVRGGGRDGREARTRRRWVRDWAMLVAGADGAGSMDRLAGGLLRPLGGAGQLDARPVTWRRWRLGRRPWPGTCGLHTISTQG